jgi:hypothetical protein
MTKLNCIFLVLVIFLSQQSSASVSLKLCMKSINSAKVAKSPIHSFFDTKAVQSEQVNSIALIWKKPANTDSVLPSEADHKAFFLQAMTELDKRLQKDPCLLDNLDLVFVYPGISYAISSSQLAMIRKFKPGSAMWNRQVIVRLSNVRI